MLRVDINVLPGFRALPLSSGPTAFDYGSIGRGFKSLRAHLKMAVRSMFRPGQLNLGHVNLGHVNLGHVVPTFAHTLPTYSGGIRGPCPASGQLTFEQMVNGVHLSGLRAGKRKCDEMPCVDQRTASSTGSAARIPLNRLAVSVGLKVSPFPARTRRRKTCPKSSSLSG